MSDNVVYPSFVTMLDIPAERILDGALKANLQSCVVLGYDSEGEFYFASSIADGGTVLWLMRIAEDALLRGSLMK